MQFSAGIFPILEMPEEPTVNRPGRKNPGLAHAARRCSQSKTKEVPLLHRKPSYCLSKTKLLLLEELNNAGIVAVRVFAVYDAAKALAVLR